MPAHRIVIYGNAGSGKTTMARQLALEFEIAHLSLDDICWADAGVRLSLTDSIAHLETFIAAHLEWVVDGCYGDLIEAALPYCSELRFLNPGIEACVRNCRSRPWEASYCSSAEEQQRLLEPLIVFVREYETRTDEFSLARHRAIFDGFSGLKQEFVDLSWR